ncbi:MAG: hypothetical protein Q4F39_08280 [Bacteroidia bacterium]|nr:hypothetical protein [Bacteroidia bacterium]
MKTTFRFIIAAMAAISMFSSCQKELANETASSTTDGVRTISVQFDNSTKASLSGLAPTFTNNDKIRVSNTEKSEECTVTVSGAGATFTTTLSGALTAIYPADAAVLASEATDAPIASSNNFKVLASQDGTMEKAIIAKATVAEGGSTATFSGLTSLFVVTPPSGATSFTIKSLNKIGTDGQRATTPDAEFINTSGEDDAAKRIITVTGVDTDGNAYVSLVPGVNLTDLSFDAGANYGMKGIPMKDITASGKPNATAANTKYTIGNANNTWHPYVPIGGKKWATENIGATETDPYGTYFMWGETNGIKPSASSFSFPTSKYYTADNHSWTKTSGFAWANCPWTNGTFNSSSNKNVFTKYTNSDDYAKSGTADNKTKLDLADDAAYANWGGPWRMPTGGTESNADFTALAKAANASYSSSSLSYTDTITTGDAPSSQGVYYYYNVSGKTVGVYFVDSSQKKLFFPAAGFGNGTSLLNAGSCGYYWSSSLYTSGPNRAYGLLFSSGNVNPQNYNHRYYGFSVRPVSD